MMKNIFFSKPFYFTKYMFLSLSRVIKLIFVANGVTSYFVTFWLTGASLIKNFENDEKYFCHQTFLFY
jgi:hypothetical protein